MFKKLMFFTVLALLAVAFYPVDGNAQVKTYGKVGDGFLFENGGKTAFASAGFAKTPMYTDTSSGFVVFNETGYYYADRGDVNDVQSVSTWIYTQKYFNFIGVRWFSAIGTGYIVEVQDNQDNQAMAVAVDFGVNIANSFGVSVTVAHQPVANAGDFTSVLLNLDLFP